MKPPSCRSLCRGKAQRHVFVALATRFKSSLGIG